MSSHSSVNLSYAHQALARAGLESTLVNQLAIDRLEKYFSLRGRWAGTHNLAGPEALRNPWQIDLLDACALAGQLQPNMVLVDVGTGSGTPGLILACLMPELPIILVEPIAKRTAFLRSAISALRLTSVRVKRGRWPMNVSHETYQIVSRAVVNPADWPYLAVSADPPPAVIYRMLALHRPIIDLEKYQQTAELSYSVQAEQDRLLQTWQRHEGNANAFGS